MISIFISAKVLLGISREKAMFQEYGHPLKLVVAAVSAPVSLICLVTLPRIIGVWPSVVGSLVLCAVTFYFSWQNKKKLEVSGTSKTSEALKTTELTVVLGIFSLVLLGLNLVVNYVASI